MSLQLVDFSFSRLFHISCKFSFNIDIQFQQLCHIIVLSKYLYSVLVYACMPSRRTVLGNPQHGKFAISCWDSWQPSWLEECAKNVTTTFHYAVEDHVWFVSSSTRRSGDFSFNSYSRYVTDFFLFITIYSFFTAHFQLCLPNHLTIMRSTRVLCLGLIFF